MPNDKAHQIALKQVFKTRKGLRIWSALLGGCALVVFITGIAVADWVSIIHGLYFISTAVVGFMGAQKGDLRYALWYYRLIFIGIFLICLLGIIGIATGVSKPCDPKASAALCQNIHDMAMMMGLLSICIVIFIYGGCAYCARQYIDDLKVAIYGQTAATTSPQQPQDSYDHGSVAV